MYARILLKAVQGEEAQGWSDERISQALEVSLAMIERERQRFLEEGMDVAISRRPHSERPNKRKLDEEYKAHLIAVTFGEKPEGEEPWSLQPLANHLVKLGRSNK